MRDPQDRQRFAEHMGALLELFDPERAGQPDRRAVLLKVYWQALQDLTIEEFSRAAETAMNGCKWMPKPVELRGLLEGVPLDARIAQTWEVLLASMRRVGAYGSVNFGDPVLHATVRAMGGWQSLCRRESEWLATFGKADFAKTYRALWDAPLAADQARHLEGQTEVESAAWHAEWRERSRLRGPERVETGLPTTRRHAAMLEAAAVDREALPTATEPGEPLAKVRLLVARIGG